MKKFLVGLFLAIFLTTNAFASISNQTNKVFGSGNGVTTVFSYPFKIFNKTDLQVYLIDTLGVATLKTLTTDYTVVISSTTEGGTVTFLSAPLSGWQTFIKRVEPLTQSLVLASEGALPAKQIENQLDRAMMVNIQNAEAIGRAIQLSITTTSSALTFPDPIADQVIKYNAAGTALTTAAYSTADVAAAAASASAASGYASTATTQAGTATTQAGNALSSANAAAASAASIALPLAVASGGTALTTAGAVANRVMLTTDGSALSFGQVGLATMVTGTLPVGNGGTGATAAANAANGVVVLDANGSLSGKAFGVWVNKSSSYAAQQATTDGFVLARIEGTSQTYIDGYTDGNADPTTILAESGVNTAAINAYGFICMPVKKNDYWKVIGTNPAVAITVYWIPLGS